MIGFKYDDNDFPQLPPTNPTKSPRLSENRWFILDKNVWIIILNMIINSPEDRHERMKDLFCLRATCHFFKRLLDKGRKFKVSHTITWNSNRYRMVRGSPHVCKTFQHSNCIWCSSKPPWIYGNPKSINKPVFDDLKITESMKPKPETVSWSQPKEYKNGKSSDWLSFPEWQH